ncbi:MAG TPA: hypothetical protein VFL12_01210 [Thermoanaerobaculia bacterium]|nr:hypothetical protein [Thermoanaerobaculia bacterium]
MKITRLLADFARVFAVTLMVSVLVTLLWNLIVHGTGTLDWETSLRFAVVFGISVTWIERRRGSGESP